MEKFNEKELIPIDESHGRKGLPTNKGPEEMKHVDEGEQSLRESETAWKGKHFEKFIPIEEVADPDTLEGGSRIPFYEIPDEDFDDLMEEFSDGLSELTAVDEMRSKAKSSLPPEIRQIIRENSVSNETWKQMKPDQKAELKRNVQKKIQEHYLSRPKKMIHRKP